MYRSSALVAQCNRGKEAKRSYDNLKMVYRRDRFHNEQQPKMSTVSWGSFEDKVRAVASFIWNGKCEPQNIGGVDVDGVMMLSKDAQIFIEMTVRRDLDKVREDINKLQLARSAYLSANNSFPRCYCVVNGAVTRAMKDAGSALNIQVISFDDFANIFFDFQKYSHARLAMAFGSAINPRTGARDERDYVPVSYLAEHSQRELTIADIGTLLRSGKKIVLLGEYGTGKSRCSRELFSLLAAEASASNLYPLALDLRDFWGLKRAPEIISRHMSDLGLEPALQTAAIRALNADRVILLLDGFDELGSQAWSDDTEKLKAIRAKSLEGVKELLSRTTKGAIISGREHYFNNNEEMFTALGLPAASTVIIRCKNEFTEAEMREFFKRYVDLDVMMPEWLPRRPLVCQTIADMGEEELDQMFGIGQDELSFFDHFISVLCQRDARISASFDAVTIERVLSRLARMTRTRPSNVGPITLRDVQSAFEAVVGQMPVDEASLMLQRLPALGRVKSESNDRQFIDSYILDGLRARDSGALLKMVDRSLEELFGTAFINPLDVLGQRLLGRDISASRKNALEIAKRAAAGSNKVLACDIVAGFLQAGQSPISFDGLVINDGNFLKLDLTNASPQNLSLVETVFGTLVLPSSPPLNTVIRDSVAQRVVGVSSPTAMPAWIINFEADKFDSTESISRIRRIGLPPNHEILATIIRKTFFQKGSGRKEEALLRGLGDVSDKAAVSKIVNYLLNAGVLTRFKGNEGWVYSPNRKFAGQMRQMLYELQTSQDHIWNDVAAL
ncbi:NACHT domain-containing protein [Bradyrhizobium sp. SZCCHNRI1058]|uniref:NACHT domain-containing protein n=1 Tax=Bradyrhizobium sp. SZCCHNRI1058 TaxID=3057279 RepID=UPI002916B4DB|nr:NACHT domain-containing protein [Bradyrhizobium sp. SZCCHNRI1058]